MQQIPLIRAATVAGVANVVDARGGAADRMLEHARIPVSVREDPVGFVPGRSVWTFVDEIARREGPRDFMFEMASLSQWRRARWAPPMAHAVTLGDALRLMGPSWMREIPMVRMGLTVRGGMAWFWRQRIPDVCGWEGNEPAEQYTLSFMLEVIRAAAGPDWRPAQLMLECSPDGWGAAARALAGVRKLYGQRLLAVGIPSPLLALPISIEPLFDPGPPGEPAGEDFRTSLRQVLQMSMSEGLPAQDIIAEKLGMGGRSLRRRLALEGTCWRSIVQDVKFARASERLLKGGTAVHAIAQELGFSDPAHFTRFFRNRTGVPPIRWREHVESARELADRGPH